METEREGELVAQAVAGNKVAVELLLSTYHVRLRGRIARQIPAALRSTIDADDVLQEAHTEVIRRIRTFEPRTPDAFGRWFATILLNKLKNAIRRARAAKRGGAVRVAFPVASGDSPWRGGLVRKSMVRLLDQVVAPGRTPSSVSARKEALRAMYWALEELPDACRQAVWLVYIEGQPLAAVAAAMGRTEVAVQNLCQRGKARLRQLMGNRSSFLSTSD